jgi:hypothetical protein
MYSRISDCSEHRAVRRADQVPPAAGTSLSAGDMADHGGEMRLFPCAQGDAARPDAEGLKALSAKTSNRLGI